MKTYLKILGLILIALYFSGCAKPSDSPANTVTTPKIARLADKESYGLIDICGSGEFSELGAVRCFKQSLHPVWGSWSGVDFKTYTGYTTYRPQFRDPKCDPQAPSQTCQGAFGDYKCCPYLDYQETTILKILPLKLGCTNAEGCF